MRTRFVHVLHPVGVRGRGPTPHFDGHSRDLEFPFMCSLVPVAPYVRADAHALQAGRQPRNILHTRCGAWKRGFERGGHLCQGIRRRHAAAVLAKRQGRAVPSQRRRTDARQNLCWHGCPCAVSAVGTTAGSSTTSASASATIGGVRGLASPGREHTGSARDDVALPATAPGANGVRHGFHCVATHHEASTVPAVCAHTRAQHTPASPYANMSTAPFRNTVTPSLPCTPEPTTQPCTHVSLGFTLRSCCSQLALVGKLSHGACSGLAIAWHRHADSFVQPPELDNIGREHHPRLILNQLWATRKHEESCGRWQKPAMNPRSPVPDQAHPKLPQRTISV